MNLDNETNQEDTNNNQQMGEDHMAVNNQELEMMNKEQQTAHADEAVFLLAKSQLDLLNLKQEGDY